jgi:hypothetical protein
LICPDIEDLHTGAPDIKEFTLFQINVQEPAFADVHIGRNGKKLLNRNMETLVKSAASKVKSVQKTLDPTYYNDKGNEKPAIQITNC